MKNDLFILVKSLSPSEKRYFKIQNANSREKAYMRLFEWMDSLDSYEDALAEKAFAGESFMKQFGVIKNYLKESLLDGLRSFHKNKSPLIQLRNRIDYIELLFQRRHPHLASKEARSAGKIANAAGYIGLRIECLKWEIKISRFQKSSRNKIAELRKQLMELARQEITEAEVSALFDEVFDLIRQSGQTASKYSTHIIQKHMEEAASFQDQTLGIHARIILHQIFAFLFLLKTEHGKMNEEYHRAIQLVESSKPYQRFRPSLVLNLYTSYLESCFLNNTFDQTEEVTRRMKKLPTRNRAEEIRLETIALSLQIQQFIRSENFQGAAELEKEVSELIKQYGEKIPLTNRITLVHNLAISLFLTGRHVLCKKWLRQILNQTPSSNRMDIWEFARLLFPVVLWEIRDMGLLEYEIRNSERFFARRGQLTRFEGLVLNLLKECLKTTVSKEEEEIRTRYRKSLSALPSKLRNHLGYEVIVQWV